MLETHKELHGVRSEMGIRLAVRLCKRCSTNGDATL